MLFRVDHVAPGPRPTLVISRPGLSPLWSESAEFVAHQHTRICEAWLQKCYEKAAKFLLETQWLGIDPHKMKEGGELKEITSETNIAARQINHQILAFSYRLSYNRPAQSQRDRLH
jgi:hypothetical protein